MQTIGDSLSQSVYECHVLGSNSIDSISNNKIEEDHSDEEEADDAWDTWADDGSDIGDSDVGSEQDDNEDEMR